VINFNGARRTIKLNKDIKENNQNRIPDVVPKNKIEIISDIVINNSPMFFDLLLFLFIKLSIYNLLSKLFFLDDLYKK